ncbi:MAG TPA: XdhC/CoxI family protein [Candidatus Acidoferrales bacterium]
MASGDVFEEIVRLRRSGRKAALATIVHTEGSIPSYETSRLLIRDDGSIVGTVGGGCVEAEVWAAAQEVMREERPRKLTFHLNNEASYDHGLICGGTVEIFLEPILPQAFCYIFGAGHISLSLSKVATLAGFSTVIVDDRPAFANRERFPEASDVIAEDFDTACSRIQTNESCFILIVTRGHKDDMRVMRWAAGVPNRYIGMIGSKRKVISVFRALEKEGVSSERFAEVHAPVGLEIGALTPEEIAVSIVAEMIAVRRHAEGLPSKSASQLYQQLSQDKG